MELVFVMHVCDVCMLIDKDLTAKECTYCERCDAHICREDINRWDRRAAAMTKRATLKAALKMKDKLGCCGG